MNNLKVFKFITLVLIFYFFTQGDLGFNGLNNSANALSPSNAEKLFRQGKELYYRDENEAAIKLWLQALGIYQNNNPLKESEILSNISLAYIRMRNAPEALKYAQKAVQRSEGTHPDAQSFALFVLGVAYNSYELYPEAVQVYEKALSITQKTSDPQTKAQILIGLGEAYSSWGKYDQAIKAFGDAKKLAIEIRNTRIKEQAEEHLNYLYFMVSNPGYRNSEFDESFRKCEVEGGRDYLSYQRKADCFRKIGAKGQETTAQIEAGTVCFEQGNYSCALESFNQALAISQEIKVREREAEILRRIATIFYHQNRIELAIVFLKKSVSIYESIRAESVSLPSELKNTYIQQVSPTYRDLADLLLSEERVLEAQQVLELLKIQELRDYTHNTRAGGSTPGIDFDATERKILQAYNSLIDFGQKIRDCQSHKVQCSDADLNQLTQLRAEQTKTIQQILKTLEADLAKRTEQDKNALDPKNDLSRKAQEIIAAQPDTVLIYSLVTDDRLWVVLASEADVLRKFEVKVSQKQLTDAVLKFRQLMKACESRTCGTDDLESVQEVSQQLYGWLLPPELRQELQGRETRQRPIRNLVFAPDRVTRYIPFAALFDGKNYLIENYAVSTIVSAKLTDTRDRLPTNPQEVPVLALGLSNPVPPEFGALKNVPIELDAIVKQTSGDANGTFPGLKRLNQEFDWLTLQKNLYGHKILHIATHGKFVPGSFEASYLLLGTGKPMPISQIEQLSDLVGVHLVVLSACETALGGKREQDGLEIAGISNSFLERGAKAVLASLWQVNDSSTSLLMQRFYHNLATGKMTKAEALRQAQLTMIQTGSSAAKQAQGDSFILPSTNSSKPAIDRNFSHPYYWAPFILIGNGL